DVLVSSAAAVEPDLSGTAARAVDFFDVPAAAPCQDVSGADRAMSPSRDLFQRHRQLLMLLAMTALTWVMAALLVDGFATGASSRNILMQVVTLAIVAAGQTVVIISGGIDLSIPWMMSV